MRAAGHPRRVCRWPGWSRPGWSCPGWSRPEWSRPGWSCPGWSCPDGAARMEPPGWSRRDGAAGMEEVIRLRPPRWRYHGPPVTVGRIVRARVVRRGSSGVRVVGGAGHLGVRVVGVRVVGGAGHRAWRWLAAGLSSCRLSFGRAAVLGLADVGSLAGWLMLEAEPSPRRESSLHVALMGVLCRPCLGGPSHGELPRAGRGDGDIGME